MDFEAHCSDMPKVNQMFMDTIAMGFACGVTRCRSMMWGGGECAEPLAWLGVGSWHSTSHGNPVSAGQQKLIKLHTYLSEEFAYFIGKLKALNLFDSTTTLWATQNGNSTETGFSQGEPRPAQRPVRALGRAAAATSRAWARWSTATTGPTTICTSTWPTPSA